MKWKYSFLRIFLKVLILMFLNFYANSSTFMNCEHCKNCRRSRCGSKHLYSITVSGRRASKSLPLRLARLVLNVDMNILISDRKIQMCKNYTTQVWSFIILPSVFTSTLFLIIFSILILVLYVCFKFLQLPSHCDLNYKVTSRDHHSVAAHTSRKAIRISRPDLSTPELLRPTSLLVLHFE